MRTAVGAKVRWIRGGWYVVTHAEGRRVMTAVGPDRAEADRIAAEANLQLAAKRRGGLGLDPGRPMPVREAARAWLELYGPTLALSTRATARSAIECHLVPRLASVDLRGVTEEVVVRLAGEILDLGRSGETVRTVLGVLS